MARQVVIIDSSTLIQIKSSIGIEHQWEFLREMERLVIRGSLALPRQVAKELKEIQFPDAPGAWATAAYPLVKLGEPDDAVLAEVLVAAPQLVEVDAPADREAADPYVLAMALAARREHPDWSVAVVTEDVVDRLPAKSSLASACKTLGMPAWRLDTFRDWVDESGASSRGD